jgi:hypothetical protein
MMMASSDAESRLIGLKWLPAFDGGGKEAESYVKGRGVCDPIMREWRGGKASL